MINLPAAVLAVGLAVAGRGDERLPEVPRPVQAVGAAAIALTFGGLTFALIEGAQNGFASVWWAFRLSLAGFALLISSERRSAHPLLPMELLQSRVFGVANMYTLLVYAALGGSTFYLALYLQSAAVGYTPARASLVFLPISIVMFFIAARFGRLADRDGPRRLLILAPMVMAVGLVLLTLVTSQPVHLAAGRAGACVRALDAGRADHVDGAQGRAGRVRGTRGGGQHDGVAPRWADRDAASGRGDHAGVCVAAPHPNVDPFAGHVCRPLSATRRCRPFARALGLRSRCASRARCWPRGGFAPTIADPRFVTELSQLRGVRPAPQSYDREVCGSDFRTAFAGAVLGAMLAGVVAIVAGVALDVVMIPRTGPTT